MTSLMGIHVGAFAEQGYVRKETDFQIKNEDISIILSMELILFR